MDNKVILPMPVESDPKEKILTPEECEVFSRDPASFLVAASVTGNLRDSIAELRNLITGGKPDLTFIFERVVAAMARLKIIRILGDKYVVLKSNPFLLFSQGMDFGFMPKVISILAKRIYKNGISDKLVPGEKMYSYYFPDNPVIQRKVREIEQKYMREMNELVEWSVAHPEHSGEKVRMSVIMNGNLDPEDF